MDNLHLYKNDDLRSTSTNEKKSEIVQFYKDKNIFITGTTGFLGQLFVEKLLRTCPHLNKIYILVRPKKGKDPAERMKEIFDGPIFDPLRRKLPNFQEKIILLSGDIAQLGLGLSQEDKCVLVNEINCIIHSAATVRFDEKLRLVGEKNVRSVIEIIKLARQMKNLKGMLYISTAFSNCNRSRIEETFYKPSITATELFQLLDIFDDDQLEKITPMLLGNLPNTYVFSKSVAENVIKTESGGLPIGVCRPAIIISTSKEPLSGWINNVYGPTGLLVAGGIGLVHSFYGQKENIAEIVPADYVINCSLAALWEIAKAHTFKNESSDSPMIYNFVSSSESPITWENYQILSQYGLKIPTLFAIWHYFFQIRSSKFSHSLVTFLCHTVPAHIVDFLAVCLGKEPQLVNGYKKIDKFANSLEFFTFNKWKFTNSNVTNLWNKLNTHDRDLFQFSMNNFDWEKYFKTYLRGVRIYLFKDPMDTVPEARKKAFQLKVKHYGLCGVLICLCAIALFLIFKLILLVLS